MARSLLFGSQAPIADYSDIGGTKTASTNYEGMHPYYRWFRQDRLVRRCILTNAYFAVLAAGFETVLQATKVDDNNEVVEDTEALEKYKDVKPFIDNLNKTLGMDRVLFVSQIKRSIYGQMGWEIVLDDDGIYPAWLLSLQSEKLKPKVSKKFELLGFTYSNKKKLQYKPDEVFYFVNLQLEEDYLGLSDIEPIVNVCNARNVVFWENYPEIVRTLWANSQVAQADTSGMTIADATAFLSNLGSMMRAGKALAVNKSVTITEVQRTADISGLIQMNLDFKEEIIGEFQTPRFLLGQPVENRATAYAEFEAYIDGIISGNQNELARILEAWYDQWIRAFLVKNHEFRADEDEALPVEIKIKFKKVRTSDLVEQAKAAAALWGQGGLGPLGIRGDYVKVWEMMDWDPEELKPTPNLDRDGLGNE